MGTLGKPSGFGKRTGIEADGQPLLNSPAVGAWSAEELKSHCRRVSPAYLCNRKLHVTSERVAGRHVLMQLSHGGASALAK